MFSIYSEIRETEELLNGTTKNNKYYYGTEKGMRGFHQLKKQRQRHRGSSFGVVFYRQKKMLQSMLNYAKGQYQKKNAKEKKEKFTKNLELII